MLCSSMRETEMIHANTHRSLVHSCLIRKNIFLSLNAGMDGIHSDTQDRLTRHSLWWESTHKIAYNYLK